MKECWLRSLELGGKGQRCVMRADGGEVFYSPIYQPLITCFLCARDRLSASRVISFNSHKRFSEVT